MCCRGGREASNQQEQRGRRIVLSRVPAGGFGFDVWPLAERIHNDWETLGRLKEFWFLVFLVPDWWEYSGYVARPGKPCLPVTLRQPFLH